MGKRRNSGSAHGRTNLEEADIEKIRNLASEGLPITVLMKRYGVSKTPMFYIVTGKTWVDAPGPIRGVDYRAKRGPGINPLTSQGAYTIEITWLDGREDPDLFEWYLQNHRKV